MTFPLEKERKKMTRENDPFKKYLKISKSSLQVGFHDNSPAAIRLERSVKTDREAVKRIEKTRREVAKPDLAGERQAFDLEATRARKAAAAARKAEEKAAAAAAAAAKEARSYDKLLTSEAMTTPAEVAAKYESAAAFEEDFM